jgi:threonylcarbamoyladenosine tRNA methylthiotransferase MtaB
MTNFFVHNFGCRATQADAAAIRQSLLARGYLAAETEKDSDLVVLNTCTVTSAADAEARESIRRIHRANPVTRIVVTGCYAQRAPQELASLAGVSLVVGNSHQTEIASLVSRTRDFVPLASIAPGTAAPPQIHRSEMASHRLVIDAPSENSNGDRTRPTLKIQDGCNHRCAYCVIPSVRGRSRSLTPDRVISEIQGLISAGAREIVLSGIDLGSYGRDLSPRFSLRDMICKILDETSLDRLRISSIEPVDVNGDFADLLGSTSRIAPHFHMPLQSGSDRILHAMHRWYRAAHYARRVELIRERLPHASIGADVIAGFPGETGKDQMLTMQFLEELPLSYLHVFSYSPRPGTEAASLPDAVPPQEIHIRAQELRALGAVKGQVFRAWQEGRRMRVLTLNRNMDGWTDSLSGNYLKVKIEGTFPRNQWFDVIFSSTNSPLPPIR